jgi:hypothetical protein
MRKGTKELETFALVLLDIFPLVKKDRENSTPLLLYSPPNTQKSNPSPPQSEE